MTWDASIAIYVIAFAFIAIGLARVPAYWRGESLPDHRRNLTAIWPFGERSLGGWMRAAPAGAVSFTFGALCAVSADVGRITTGQPHSVAVAAYYVTGAIAALGFVITLSVAVFAWPEVFVPPPLRKPR
jgi:hypothetical protein